jgi:hypothetical protein
VCAWRGVIAGRALSNASGAGVAGDVGLSIFGGVFIAGRLFVPRVILWVECRRVSVRRR